MPEPRLRREQRVSAIMVEVRRGLYRDAATGKPTPHFPAVAVSVERAARLRLGAWVAAWLGSVRRSG